MYSNKDAVDRFNEMVALGTYYSSGRPVAVDPQIIVDDICSKIPLTQNDKILDVGCGTGVVTIPLSKRCRIIHAMDAGAKVIEVAQERCRKENITNISYSIGSALELPFEDNCFDHVLMYSVIHYLENEAQVRQCVKELVRVCKPGGRILIAEIPDDKVRLEFEQRQKTPQEERILEEFKINRAEYDRLTKANINGPVKTEIHRLVLDCQRIVDEAEQIGCKGQVCLQDIRQPMSLTRRDVLLIKGA